MFTGSRARGTCSQCAPKLLTIGYARWVRLAAVVCSVVPALALGGCASSLNVFSSGSGDGKKISTRLAPISGKSNSQRARYSPQRGGASGSKFPESKWGVKASPRSSWSFGSIPKGGGYYKVGKPYVIGGRRYFPREDRTYDRVGIASWYGPAFHRRKTSNGEVFDMHALTAAHPTLPMPSYAYVTNLSNGRTILVRINDRGPYVGNRIIDLSKASADALDLKGKGTGRVRVRYAGPAPLNGDDSRERQFLARGGRGGNWQTASVRRQRAPQPTRQASSRQDTGWSPARYRASLR